MDISAHEHVIVDVMQRIGTLLCCVAGLALVVFGPEWPGRSTRLTCGNSIETTADAITFTDANACQTAMARAFDAGTNCYCSVKENPFAPAYYLALVPLPFMLALAIVSRAAARGMTAVMLILASTLVIPGPVVMHLYDAGFHIPQLLQGLAISWPQFVFFGPNLYRLGPNGGLVLPWEWAYLSMVGFWMVAAAVFGWFSRRVRSFPMLLAAAVVTITALAIAVRLIVPLFGWHATLEGL